MKTFSATVLSAGVCVAALMMLGAGQDIAAPLKVTAGPAKVFPHVRVDVQARTVEFDGTVPISLTDKKAPRVYLELIACVRDSKEHESLVMTEARPAHIHAALLSVGLKPGKPATWTQADGKVIGHAPSGDSVVIEFVGKDEAGAEQIWTPSLWIRNAKSGEAWPGGGEIGKGRWVFAGSVTTLQDGRDVYQADESGTIIGLASFGTEVIAWTGVLSADSQIDEPEWIADARSVPAMGTAITVRIKCVPAKVNDPS